MPYDAQATKQFYNRYLNFEWERLEATAYGRLQALIHLEFIERYCKQNYSVLDAGCGPGRFSIFIARMGARVTLLDLSSGQLRLAKENMTREKLLTQTDGFLEGDITNLSRFPDSHFDLTLCLGGPLSYACEKRFQAARELIRVTRPGGTVLVSVMSRLGSTIQGLQNPKVDWKKDFTLERVRSVIEEGDLPWFPSARLSIQHPAMHLFSADELKELLPGCKVLEIAASNVCGTGMPSRLDDIAKNEASWQLVVSIERALNHQAGLLDSGSHIILAVQRA